MMLIALLVTVSLQVISRFIIKAPIQWTEEGGRFIFFWVALMGASVSVKSRKHFLIAVYDPKKIQRPGLRLAVELLPEILVFMFCLLLTWYGWIYFLTGTNRMGIEVPLKMSWVYAALPVSGVTMALYTLTNMLSSITDYRQGTHSDDGREQ